MVPSSRREKQGWGSRLLGLGSRRPGLFEEKPSGPLEGACGERRAPAPHLCLGLGGESGETGPPEAACSPLPRKLLQAGGDRDGLLFLWVYYR